MAAVVLAAGESSRLGQPKQLLQYNGESLLGRTIRIAREAGAGPLVVVSGYIGEEIEAHVRETFTADNVEVVFNENWEDGMGSSIAAGVRVIMDDPWIEAALILTCDQIGLSAGLLDEMRGELEGGNSTIVVSDYGTAKGPPVMFSRAHFEALAGLSGPHGAKVMIDANPGRVGFVHFPEGAIDIDTPEDLVQLDGDG